MQFGSMMRDIAKPYFVKKALFYSECTLLLPKSALNPEKSLNQIIPGHLSCTPIRLQLGFGYIFLPVHLSRGRQCTAVSREVTNVTSKHSIFVLFVLPFINVSVARAFINFNRSLHNR